MTRQRSDNNHLEAKAQGREAFWRGLVIMLNPHVGADARLWTAAWQAAEADFLSRSGLPQTPAGGQYPLEELARLCPPDLPPPTRRVLITEKGAGRRRARMRKQKGSDAPVQTAASTRFLQGDTPWTRT